ncbi:MAG: DUF3604 domain-containing protein [Deltaproteobacteria bacterium]|nr:DUF3604 domain-containing protein [Deltaproteobacteria bacterium]MBW2446410.1 DUF3604 domain-containing protein [Deltaproteobacteria bacterium]
MTRRVARRLLWLALVFAAPAPILALGEGTIPVAQLLFMMAAAGAIVVTESARGALPLLFLVFGLQALAYSLVHWGLAWLFTRFTPPPVGAIAAAGLMVGAVWAFSTGFYDDPFRAMAITTFPGQAGEPRADFDPATWHPAPVPEPGLAFDRTEWREPCDAYDVQRQLFWGDTHIHTSYSFDAWGQGTRNTPRDAYRFAKGEELGIQPYDAAGRPLRTVKLDRPLDFTLLSDHAEVMGEVRICQTPGLPGHDALPCRLARRWPLLGYAIVNSQMMDEADPVRYGFCGPGGSYCRDTARRPWQEIQEAAEEAYDRTSACRFTSFVGFEWSGNPDSSMIHRNVLFRNEVVPQRLSNFVDDRTNEAFWKWLDESCLASDGRCDALAIPHNSNLGNGRLFTQEMADGAALSREYAEIRARIELLLEVTQHKGDSECRKNANDPLCDFETLAFGRMREQATSWEQTDPAPLSYAREILGAGLVEQARLGVNPFKLGLMAATDTHLGTPGLVDEQSFPGHGAGIASARLKIPKLPDDVRFNPGGLQAVWAEENSRDSLYAGMQRRETYGTSGPRMVVRSFTGFDLPEDLCERGDFAARGYAHGVPMGGDLAGAPSGAGVSVAVLAQRDPGSAARPGVQLQRLQVVKLWERDGGAHQKVFEVAGDPDNGARVDRNTCETSGPGFDDLCAVWQDPEFDADLHAAYYVRVVENPTCRWTAHACNAQGVRCENPTTAEGLLITCCDPDVPMTIQERAWTSPVWYTP